MSDDRRIAVVARFRAADDAARKKGYSYSLTSVWRHSRLVGHTLHVRRHGCESFCWAFGPDNDKALERAAAYIEARL